MERDGNEAGDLVFQPKWPSLCQEYRQNFSFDDGVFDPSRLPDLTALGHSGERTCFGMVEERGAVENIILERVCDKTSPIDARMPEKSGQRREVGGIG